MSKLRKICLGTASFLLLAYLLGIAFANPQSPKVRSVDVKVEKGNVTLAISADKPVQFRTLKVTDPEQAMVIEVYPAVLWGKKETKQVNVAGVRDIRIAQFSSDPDVMRVVLDLSHPIKLESTISGDHRRLRVSVNGSLGNSASKTSHVAKLEKAVKPAPIVEKPQNPQASSGEWHHVKVESKVIGRDAPGHMASLRSSPGARPALSDKSLQAQLNQIFIAKASPKSKKSKSKKTTKTNENENISYSWKNADLTDVVRSLADRLHLNVIVDTAVKGTVTLDLKNVPAQQALGMILAINGYASRQIGNILVVADPAKLDKMPTMPVALGPQAIQVIPLENAKSADLQNTIKNEYPNVKVDVDPRTNSLLVRGSVGEIRQVKSLVSDLDKPVVLTPTVPPQKEVVQLNYASDKDVVSQIKPLLPSDAVLIADDRLNTIIVIGSQYAIDTVKSFVSAVDVPSPQVMLEMQVISVEVQANRELGIEWDAGTTTHFTETSAGEANPAGGGNLGLPPAGGGTVSANSLNLNNIGFHTWVRDNMTLTAKLHWLVSQQKAKVLGAPRVATLNNKEANIQLGSRIPIVYFDPRAGLYQAQYIDVGVILRITPIISPDGSITVHVNPQVSQVTGFNQTFPTLSTRQADTNVRVKNGETIILGGLLQDQTSDAITKIPLLGDIPIIGEMFRHRTTTSDKTDLVVSITPTLLANK